VSPDGREAPGARELELKAVVPDAAALRARLESAGATCTFRGRMRDRRYDRPGRSLFARDEVLRVRTFEPAADSRETPGDVRPAQAKHATTREDSSGAPVGAAHAELTWKGPTKQTGGYKEREELQLDVGDADALGNVLARLGFEVSDAIDRWVEYHELAGAAVRIEWYPRMDVLVEVEGTPDAIERAVAATGIPRADFNADRLLDFAARYRERTGTEPVLRRDGLGPNEAPGWPKWAEKS
jgi:adenylate cyclase class IV